MARIAQAELTMVDLRPKVERTDAIQAFVSQETPILALTDAEGAVGTGYSYTIGTGGPAVISLLRETLLPRLIGREAEEIERHLARPAVRHPCHGGGRHHVAGAGGDRHRAVGPAVPPGGAAALAHGRGRAEPRADVFDRRRLAAPAHEALVDDALAMQEAGFSGAKIKIGKPSVAEDGARLAAVRAALGDAFAS